ncbi:lytic transglycosylase domain-containing protein [Altererythrobacter sp. KTW20L]|uniref:lytic transglycosylase domain-containing protein n=1 Tax=Altererythrobacter sp. KTW20L TaxID=2942210 RepID=UPI0020BEB527|nr:lytic transglycosylase domain-containing protein [Altererythrobacter sp. KTW20L]MCL6251856.1 lytic transglycosylase domain-containing protein [Altererythrobacter sp. KTW20L]
MKILASAFTGLLLAALPATVQAQGSREYFIAHVERPDSPRQLSEGDAAYYRSVFRAIDGENWAEVQRLFAERSDGPLHAVAQATYYTHARSPRVEASQIEQWLQVGHELPQAAQLVRLGQTRGLAEAPRLPTQNQFRSVGSFPRRVRPSSIQDTTMPDEVAAGINRAITNDDPDGARQLLDGVDANLSPEARAEWRTRVAWSYFIENMDPQSLALARIASEGRGPWVAEGEWTRGLAAWRLNDCDEAQTAFRSSANQAQNIELRAAALYWAHRAALRCRQPGEASALLALAAGEDQTMYGMLAAEQLGRRLPDRVNRADLSADDLARLTRLPNVRTAIALAEIGQDILASEVLLHQARIGDASDYAALSRLARDLGFVQTQLYMAYNAPSGGQADPASYYPTPRWTPLNGWRVDPALAYAHILQESNFRASARSPADAMGLMQITPITVRQHAPRLELWPDQVDIYEPRTNLAFGQRNLEMLQEDPVTRDKLPKIMAAYNAGLTPVRRWESDIRDLGDPLLYMEAIPYWETRSYVAIVMRNYWMYERQADAPSPSRIALAQNAWPAFPGSGAGDGRVYMTAGGN